MTIELYHSLSKEVILNFKYQELLNSNSKDNIYKLDMQYFLYKIFYLYNKKSQNIKLENYIKELIKDKNIFNLVEEINKKQNENQIFLDLFKQITDKEIIFPTEFLIYLSKISNFVNNKYNQSCNDIDILFFILFSVLMVKEEYEELKNYIKIPEKIEKFIINTIYNTKNLEITDIEANKLLDFFNHIILETLQHIEKNINIENIKNIEQNEKEISIVPIKDFKLFYRKKEVENILINCLKKDNNNILLYGKTGVGKTSLVNNLYTYAKSEYEILKDTYFYEIDALNIFDTYKETSINKLKVNIIPILYAIKNELKDKKGYEDVIIIINFKKFLKILRNESNIFGKFAIEKVFSDINMIMGITKELKEQLNLNFYIKYIFNADIDIKKTNTNFYKISPIEIKMSSDKNELIDIVIKQIRSYELYYNRKITKEDLKLILADNKFNNFYEVFDYIDMVLAKSDFYTNGKYFILNNNNNKINTLSLKDMEKYLKSNIFGQNEAIENIIDKFEIVKAGLNEQQKPLASFMLNGNSGTGKTEMARQLAKFLDVKLVRYDMSEYYDKFMISKLLGSPAGYVGYDEGSILVRDLKNNPDAIVLFDEIEKADPAVIRIFLQILEEGIITAANGEKLNFSNNIVLFTTNAGAKSHIEKESGFIRTKIQIRSNNVLKKEFPIEFLNRIDGIIYFNELTKDNLIKIIYKELNKVMSLFNNNIEIKISDKAIEKLIELGFNPEYGAREIKRILDKNIKILIAKEINNSNINLNEAEVLKIDFVKDKFQVDFDNSKKELKKINYN